MVVDGGQTRTSFPPFVGWGPASPSDRGHVNICPIFSDWGLGAREGGLLGFINPEGKNGQNHF